MSQTIEKITYEEAKDSIGALKELRKIAKFFAEISTDPDNALIDDQDRIDASKLEDNTKQIIDKIEDLLSSSKLCTLCGGVLVMHSKNFDDYDDVEYYCSECGN